MLNRESNVTLIFTKSEIVLGYRVSLYISSMFFKLIDYFTPLAVSISTVYVLSAGFILYLNSIRVIVNYFYKFKLIHDPTP